MSNNTAMNNTTGKNTNPEFDALVKKAQASYDEKVAEAKATLSAYRSELLSELAAAKKEIAKKEAEAAEAKKKERAANEDLIAQLLGQSTLAKKDENKKAEDNKAEDNKVEDSKVEDKKPESKKPEAKKDDTGVKYEPKVEKLSESNETMDVINSLMTTDDWEDWKAIMIWYKPDEENNLEFKDSVQIEIDKPYDDAEISAVLSYVLAAVTKFTIDRDFPETKHILSAEELTGFIAEKLSAKICEIFTDGTRAKIDSILKTLIDIFDDVEG